MGEPTFQGLKIHLFATLVIEHLIATHLTDRKIARLRMSEVQAAYRTCGIHREAVCQGDPNVFLGMEEIEK